ncbi:MAG: hypothetical protein QM709_09955 [Spongiibacteraceae bacterium]
MDEKILVPLCMGVAFLIGGFFMIKNERFALWSLSTGRSRIWITLLGQERAVKVTRYFFGPLVIVLGLLCFVMAFVPDPTP